LYGNESEKVWELALEKSALSAEDLQKIPFTLLVPDLKGMCAKDAVYLLENRGLKVKIRGAGSVIYQSLPAGSSFKKGDLIIIELG